MNCPVFPSCSVTADLLCYFSFKYPSMALEREGKSNLCVNTVLWCLFNAFVCFESSSCTNEFIKPTLSIKLSLVQNPVITQIKYLNHE